MLYSEDDMIEEVKKTFVSQFYDAPFAFRKKALQLILLMGVVISIVVLSLLRPIKILFF